MGKVERVLFLHPPQTDYFLPPLGPACLIAYLKAHRPDLSYRFLDLNVDYVRWLLEPAQIAAALQHSGAAVSALWQKQALSFETLEAMQTPLTTLQVAREVLAAPRPLVAYLCDAEIVCDRPRYEIPKRALGHVMHLHSLVHGQQAAKPEKMLWVEHGIPAWDSAYLLEALATLETNPYMPFLREHAQLIAELMQCDVLCLSLLYYEQTLGAFTLAAFAKQLRPTLPVLLGGSWVTAIRHGLQRVPALFAYVDAVIPYAGEASLCEAITRLDRGESLLGSPNAMTCHEGRVVWREVANFPRIEALPAPDFDEFALDRYLLPAPVLPFQLTRGCYWGQCTFCTHHMAQGLGYSVAQTTAIGYKLAYLAERYQTNRFYFVDEAIPPAKLREIPKAVKDQRLDIHWMSECRLERSLTQEVFEQLAASGCRLLLFGLETGSQRVMDLMKKGVRIEDAQRCIRACATAGIYTGVFLMFGFPTETIDDALATYRFVQHNRPWIDNLGTSVFTLTAESPIAADPARFGVTLVEETFRGVPLKEDLAYHVETGFDHDAAAQVTAWLEQMDTFQDILQRCPFPRRSHALFVPSRLERNALKAGPHQADRLAPACATLATLHLDLDVLRARFAKAGPAIRRGQRLQPGKMRAMFPGVMRETVAWGDDVDTSWSLERVGT